MSSGNQVRASHILIKHEGSRRKASWKDPEGRIIKNTTRDSAVSQLKVFREDILSGKAKFQDLASPTVAPPSAAAISVRSAGARCRNLLKMRHLVFK